MSHLCDLMSIYLFVYSCTGAWCNIVLCRHDVCCNMTSHSHNWYGVDNMVGNALQVGKSLTHSQDIVEAKTRIM